uniref:Aminotransferase-like plant mobile domain-containing protein n=1 Tax=Leersia perrieri TaxID=77586 RepID=A0A0D9Y174_9ORYZ
MPRLPKFVSARRSARRHALADLNSSRTARLAANDDNDFVDPPSRRVNVAAKFVALVSRCVPSAITPIFRRLNKVKTDLVKEMGFGGLLHMPLITNRRDFSYWLLSRVSPTRSAIKLSNGDFLPFCTNDVTKVFGIPCEGEELDSPSPDVVAHVKTLIARRLGVTDFKDVNKEILEEVILKYHKGFMSDDDKDAFKTAFLILVMMKFLAPQANLDNICPRYFYALVDTSEISKFNWSAYVLNEILAAAEAAQKKIADGQRCGYINGCVIFLQIFYLDNLDLGHLSFQHGILPRIALYDNESLKQRYKMDMRSKSVYKATEYGKLKLLYGQKEMYVTPDQVTSIFCVVICRMLWQMKFPEYCLRNTEIYTLNLSQIPQEREELVTVTEGSKNCTSANMSSHNQDQSSHGYTCSLDNVVGETGIDVNQKIPQTPSLGNDVGDGRKVGDDSTDVTANKSINLNRTIRQETPTSPQFVPIRIYTGIDIEPPSFDLNIDWSPSKKTDTPISPRSISREIAAASLDVLADIYYENSQGEIKPYHGSKRDLPEPRVLQFEGNIGSQSQNTLTSSPLDLIPDQVRTRAEGVRDVLIVWIRSYQETSHLKSVWISNFTHTPQTLTGAQMRTILWGNEKLEHCTCVVYTRRMLEIELEKFGGMLAYGWRHFLEPDFYLAAIAGNEWWDPKAFREQFIGDSIKYDVSKCTMPIMDKMNTSFRNLQLEVDLANYSKPRCNWHMLCTGKENMAKKYTQFESKFQLLSHARTYKEFEEQWLNIGREYGMQSENAYIQNAQMLADEPELQDSHKNTLTWINKDDKILVGATLEHQGNDNVEEIDDAAHPPTEEIG